MIDAKEAELSVIGSILLTGGKALDDIDLAATDYLHPAHEFIHRTMADMKADGKPIDQVTLADRLGKSGERIDPTIVHTAVAITGTAASVEYYARIVTEAASMRRLKTAAGRINQMVDQGGDAEEIVEAARREVDTAQSTTRSAPVQFVSETLEATIDGLDAEVESVPTPWKSVDNIIGGLRPGALYVIGARPSVGKSVAGLQLATELAKHGGVGMVSLEMPNDDINKRLISSQLQIEMSRLTDNQLKPEDWNRIAEWMQTDRAKLPLAVNDKSGATITDIKRFARDVNRRKPLAGIVVDYLQLMAQSHGDKRPRHEFVADMSRQLKILAMDMNVPVIALSQLNRNTETREDKRPKLSDLRESGAVEQDADVVILMHREIIGDNTHHLDMLVAKNRHGRTGVTDLGFAGHYSRIQDR